MATGEWRPGCTCDAGKPVSCKVLDPFGGSGTVGLVSEQLGRDSTLIDLSPEYIEMARQRIEGVEVVEVPGDNGDSVTMEQMLLLPRVEVET
jgi:16S rRNA G966 N2-methylase RsmD